MSFIYNDSHFQYSFCNQPVLFAQLENKQFKNKSKTKSRDIQIDNLAHKKCNGIIKGWRYCLMSESKGRVLVNNILFGSTLRLTVAQILFLKIKNDKDWTFRTLANPSPPTSDNISFFPQSLTPPPPSPLQVYVICASTRTVIFREILRVLRVKIFTPFCERIFLINQIVYFF